MTTTELSGKRIAFLLTDGYEDSELSSPWQAVTEAGATAVLVSPATESITGKKGHSQYVDLAVADARAGDFDALVLPGGAQPPPLDRCWRRLSSGRRLNESSMFGGEGRTRADP